MVHTLASKGLHTPLFISMEWLLPIFQPIKIFHLTGRILDGKASLSSLTVAQATTCNPATEDPDEFAKRRARLIVEAIAHFDAYTSNNGGRPHLMIHQCP